MRDAQVGLEKAEFDELARQHRRELYLHCYRMLGSIHDAEDAVQEALLRAWPGREAYAGRGSARGWLYRIATNVCLRMLERRAIAMRILPKARSRPVGFKPLGEPESGVAWLELYPVSLVEQVADPAPGPESRYETRDAISLAFIAALHVLPPRQRAVLLLRDVLGLSANETAAILDTSAVSPTS